MQRRGWGAGRGRKMGWGGMGVLAPGSPRPGRCLPLPPRTPNPTFVLFTSEPPKPAHPLSSWGTEPPTCTQLCHLPSLRPLASRHPGQRPPALLLTRLCPFPLSCPFQARQLQAATSPRGTPAADSGQSTRRPGSGPRAEPQPLPRGRGRGPGKGRGLVGGATSWSRPALHLRTVWA